MTKKSKHRKRLTGNDFKKARRAAESLYYLRLAKDGDEGVLWQNYRGPIPPVDSKAAELQLYHTPCLWHVVGIVYFRDPWGKEYRSWGFAKTNDHIKLKDRTLEPVLSSALQIAEQGTNLNQRIGQGFIMAPWNKRHPSLVPLIRKHKKDLQLTEEDILGIEDYLESGFGTYEVEETPVDVDDAIAALPKSPTANVKR